MSTVQQVLIGKSVAYRAKSGGGSIVNMADVINLADGAVALFGEDGNLITAAAGFADQKSFYIYVGGSTAANLRKSKKIVRRGAIYSAVAYDAPVKAINYVGDDGTNGYDVNLPSTLVVGTFAYLSVIETTDGNVGTNKARRYEYKVLTGDTKASVVNGLVTAMNADADRLAVAAAIDPGDANAGISLTAVNYDMTFKVTVGGILANATISGQTNTVLVNYGSGRASQISELEAMALINEGSGNYTFMPSEFFSYGQQVDTATPATYHTYNMSWEYTAHYPTHSQGAVPNYLILAVVSGASQKSTLDTLFAAAFGVVSGAEEETGASETNEAVVS